MTPAVLVVALVLSAPALYRGFVTGEMSVDAALLVFLAAALVCWVGRSLLTSLLSSYSASRAGDIARAAEPVRADGRQRRRRDDQAEGES